MSNIMVQIMTQSERKGWESMAIIQHPPSHPSTAALSLGPLPPSPPIQPPHPTPPSCVRGIVYRSYSTGHKYRLLYIQK